jgi:hypothetical protein
VDAAVATDARIQEHVPDAAGQQRRPPRSRGQRAARTAADPVHDHPRRVLGRDAPAQRKGDAAGDVELHAGESS